MHSIEGYVDQHPDALRLTLVEGNLDRTQFHLLAGQEQHIAGIRIEATVIGASHVVSFDTGLFMLHEVFACVGLEDVSSWPLDELVAEPVRRTFPGMQYEFVAQRVPWTDPEPPRLTGLVTATRYYRATNIGVVQEFPAGELSVSPKTVVVGYPDVTANGVVIETAHSYPNVQGLVVSRSTLQYT